MRKLTFYLLWIFVFSVPWEPFFSIPGIGTVSRVLGVLAMSSGTLAIILKGSLRKPGVIAVLATTFAAAALFSLMWTVSLGATTGRALTYMQLLGMLWITWEFARCVEEIESVMLAYCLGAMVSIVSALANYSLGMTAVQGQAGLRYAATNFDPNDFALTLAVSIPIAWHLFLTGRSMVRILAAAHIPLASAAILLAASRAGFLSGAVALTVIPLTLLRPSLTAVTRLAIITVCTITAAVIIVPTSSWKRILTVQQELSRGTVGGRAIIWDAGLQVFHDRPILGHGAGAFPEAVQDVVGRVASHNALMAVLVEQGIAGEAIFILLLASCAWLIRRLPGSVRKIWAVVALTWLTGVMSLDWHYSKTTWLLMALLAAHAAARERSVGAVRWTPVATAGHLGSPAIRRGIESFR